MALPLVMLGIWLSARSAANTSAQDEAAYNEVTHFISRMEADPTAMEFSREFMKEPELAELWTHYTQGRDAKRLLKSMNDQPAFRRLLGRYHDNPRFQAMAQELLSTPGISALMKTVYEERAPSRRN